MELLGVPKATLDSVGAVSRETALAMAAGALKASRADIAVAVTGVAGPGGGTASKPVGLVHLCVQRKGSAPQHQEARYGDIGRANVRLATVRTALDMLERRDPPNLRSASRRRVARIRAYPPSYVTPSAPSIARCRTPAARAPRRLP
jgi:hypothetical protein